MEKGYNLFSEQYNKLLDLVAFVDKTLFNNYLKFMDSLPDAVIEKLSTKKEFVCDGKNYRAMLDIYDGQLCFEYITYNKYLCKSVCFQPFMEDELDDDENESSNIDEEGLFLFSLTTINTEDEPSIRLNYEEQDGKVNYKGADIDGVEIDTEVFIKREDNEYFLISKQIFIDKELVVYEKKVPVKYADLISCIAYEEENEYGDDYQ